ncbi:MAG TPA: galactose-1-phosphate uridylyltransferase [Candidatus Limnocylindrales bacterium]|nr:galactose-1-phosphate uridylyltransferase [Candidatus Limnocylindrales bacterium]
MPQLRQDLITGRWVAVATERARRPDSFTQAPRESVPARDVCPFCPGHEQMTPPEVLAYRAPGTEPNGPGWWVRVVPNLYAAFKLQPEGQESHVGRFHQRDAIGACEVLISSPDHRASWPQLDRHQVEEIVQSYLDRFQAHQQNPVLEYVLILYNHGRPAGASLEHPHSQLYAISLVPPHFEEELAGARRYADESGGCVFCRTIEDERQAAQRVVFENDAFIVYCPFAARTPFETWIVPRRHSSSLGDLEVRREKPAFAEALQGTLRALADSLNDPPFNFYIHNAPLKGDHESLYHWHLELIPKLSVAAGFELGTGIWINVVKPEDSAAFLRERIGAAVEARSAV